jgi:hypothetical protein
VALEVGGGHRLSLSSQGCCTLTEVLAVLWGRRCHVPAPIDCAAVVLDCRRGTVGATVRPETQIGTIGVAGTMAKAMPKVHSCALRRHSGSLRRTLRCTQA